MLQQITAQGIADEGLRDSILDHVCCLIENSKEPIDDFENCFQSYLKQFYHHKLQEIELETQLLINFKHYYQMKKFMLLSGIAGAGILVIGNLFKFMHWPGTGILILLGISLLSLFFIPLLFFIKLKENPSGTQRWLLSIGTLLAISFCLSVLFKIFHWPYANILGNISTFGAILIFAPMYLVNSFKTKEKQTNALITVILIVASAGMLYSLTATRLSHSLQVSPWLVMQQNEKSTTEFKNYCSQILGSDSSENGKQKMAKYLGLNQSTLALKNYLFQNIANTDGPLQMEALLESNANDLVTSKLLPTDQTQAPALVEFEQALNQIYGNNKKDVTWAKNTLFGMRNSDIFMLINDIEKEALVYLLKE
jgi:hypothetical protein